MKIKDVLSFSVQEAVKYDVPALDISLLLAHALAVPRQQLIFIKDDVISSGDYHKFTAYLDQRFEKRLPVSRILGYRDFWKDSFTLSPYTLDPRKDSEILIDIAMKKFKPDMPLRILDIGTGSGCLLLSLLKEFPKATAVGIDSSIKALNVAQENANDLSIHPDRILWKQNNWIQNITDMFDLIVANPPYISLHEMDVLPPEVLHDPKNSLFAPHNGLYFYKLSAITLKNILKPNGYAIFEHGYQQQDSVTEIFSAYHICDHYQDLSRLPRAICIQHPKSSPSPVTILNTC